LLCIDVCVHQKLLILKALFSTTSVLPKVSREFTECGTLRNNIVLKFHNSVVTFFFA